MRLAALDVASVADPGTACRSRAASAVQSFAGMQKLEKA
jgi:hypothetical protein